MIPKMITYYTSCTSNCKRMNASMSMNVAPRSKLKMSFRLISVLLQTARSQVYYINKLSFYYAYL